MFILYHSLIHIIQDEISTELMDLYNDDLHRDLNWVIKEVGTGRRK